MRDDIYFQQRIQQLEEVIKQLQSKTNSMESILTALQDEVTQLKTTPGTSIEYKFDQLKIERLDGTLNIGLSPGGKGLDNLEDLSVNGGNYNVNQPQQDTQKPFSDEMYKWINQSVDHYLNQDIYADIQKVENKQRYSLTDSQRKLVVEDIKKQMAQRLPHYMMAAKPENAQSKPNQEADRILNQIRKDILGGIEIYMNNERQKSQGGNQDGT